MENEEKKVKTLISQYLGVKEFWKNVISYTYEDLVKYLYQPKDPSSLGIIRILFGLLMIADLPEERGGASIDLRWGDRKDCHFPLFSVLENPGFPYISLMYFSMWLGALGITLGFKFRWSVFLFGIPYWYIVLLDKSFWNNHTYLFGLVAILLSGTSANHFGSLDGYFDVSKRNRHVPYWNYLVLKYQFFLLYFLAGLKKTDMEWLQGYSMSNLGYHWVFSPFRLALSPEQIDYLIVHWFGFLLDLTMGFWLLVESTRPVAMLFCASFHFMNSRLFSIGMFPYLCLATMPLFCEETWPRKLHSAFSMEDASPMPSTSCIYPKEQLEEYRRKRHNGLRDKATWRHKMVVALLICHCGLQIFLPYSHFITKGYNNWTKGLYGYSWDMMVHSWNTVLVVVKVVDNKTGREHFVNSEAWTLNDRWSKHADMCMQYAHCLKRNLIGNLKEVNNDELPANQITSENISVYLDVWCSLNKRFQQRMYDPQYDLLNANWSPFQPVEWLLPVLSEYSDLRRTMDEISKEVYAWSNFSDVLFIADFPGLYLENFINDDLQNVTLTVLEGEVAYEVEDETQLQSVGVKLRKGDSTPVDIGIFHKIHTVGKTPSCYMYTFLRTKRSEGMDGALEGRDFTSYSPFPFIEDVQERVSSFLRMWSHIGNSVLYLFFGRSFHIRSKIKDD